MARWLESTIARNASPHGAHPALSTRRSRTLACASPFVLALALPSCATDDTDGASDETQVPGTGGAASAGTGGTSTATGGSAALPGGGGTPAPPSFAGAPSTATGGATGLPGAGGAPDPGAGGAPDPGAGGAPDPGTGGAPSTGPLPPCESGSLEPCGTFVSPTSGTSIPLGPYGAVMEPNVGEGFPVTIAAGDQPGSGTCAGFVGLFGQDPALSAKLLDVTNLRMDLYTVYRPANWVAGERYPIITWGNGTCAQPEGYSAVLRHVASHGFFVVAANSRWVGGNSAMTKALDFAFAANDDPASPYYQRLDTAKVGAMGHSQGSGATVTAARDGRVKVVILFNGGTSASKPFLAVSGERDIGSPTAATMRAGVDGAPQGAFLFYYRVPPGALTGHLTLMMEPERVVDATTGWWKYMLNGDPAARELFVGASCGLCNRTGDFDYGQKGLL